MTHPRFLNSMKWTVESKDADVDQETFVGLQNAKFVLSSPQDRIRAMQNLDTLIAQDDVTSLRSKAELLQPETRFEPKPIRPCLRSGANGTAC